MKRISKISLVCSFVLFIVLCVSTSYWVLQFMQSQPRKVSAPPVPKPVADVESTASLFGGALAVNANYQLKGIVLANPENQSGAIVAVDGKPAQAFRVNAELSPGIKLTEVHAGYIMILDNGVSKRVDLSQDAKSSQQGAAPNYQGSLPQLRAAPMPSGVASLPSQRPLNPGVPPVPAPVRPEH